MNNRQVRCHNLFPVDGATRPPWVSLISHLIPCCPVCACARMCVFPVLLSLHQMYQQRTVLKSRLRTPRTRDPQAAASLAAASATSLLQTPTWSGTHTSVISKSCLESVHEGGCTKLQNNWMTEAGTLQVWTALRESVHSKNFPGRRLLTAISVLQSARTSAVKTELKGFNQNLNVISIQNKAQPVYLFIKDPTVKTAVYSAQCVSISVHSLQKNSWRCACLRKAADRCRSRGYLRGTEV